MESPYIGKSQHAKDRPDWPVNLRPSEKKRQPKSRVDDVSPDSILESEVPSSADFQFFGQMKITLNSHFLPS